MQRVHVADFVRLEIMGGEARARLPVVERDAQLRSRPVATREMSISLRSGTMAPGPTPVSPWATRSPLRGLMTCTARE